MDHAARIASAKSRSRRRLEEALHHETCSPEALLDGEVLPRARLCEAHQVLQLEVTLQFGCLFRRQACRLLPPYQVCDSGACLGRRRYWATPRGLVPAAMNSTTSS